MKTWNVARAGLLVVVSLLYAKGFAQSSSDFDAMGGWKQVSRPATGSWEVGQADGRYWFFTPEGNAFFLLSVNHYPDPSKTDMKQVMDHLRTWGFNAAGSGAPEHLRERMPYVSAFMLHDASHWMPGDTFSFVDVFDPAYAKRVDETIAAHCATHRDNPHHVAYATTDIPRWDLDRVRHFRADDWVSFIRRQNSATRGKQRYLQFLRERHDEDLEAFKRAYRLPSLSSFDALADFSFEGLELQRPMIREDDEAFLALIVRQYYEVASAAVERHDPGALFMSEKFKMGECPREFMRIAAEYCDIVAYQPGPHRGPFPGQGEHELTFYADHWRAVHEAVQKPLFNPDHTCSFYTPGYPRTLWHQLESVEAQAQHYDRYLRQVIREPYIIGYQRCQYRSVYDPYRDILKQGLLDPDGKPYPKLLEAMTETNKKVWEELYR